MIIQTNGQNLNIKIGDIETLKCCIDLGFYDPDTKEWFEFEISKFKNELFEFIDFYTNSQIDYVVGYNYVGFDAQVIQYILNNHQYWAELNNQQIIDKIYFFTQGLIDNQKYKMFLPFREGDFSTKVIDVFTILGLNGEARYSSLKKIEFQIDYPNVEEMPIDHWVESLTEEEIQQVQSYRRNDVLATLEVFNLTLGKTHLDLYKGKNQLDLRFSIKEEFGLECLNLSDIKIADELLKKTYAAAINKSVSDLPKKGYFRKEIKLEKGIPKYISFKTKELQEILKNTKGKIIKQFDKYENVFTFKGTEYTLGLGGAHSTNDGQMWNSNKEYLIVDLDVGSLYPAIICNLNYYPKHLGKQLLNTYRELYLRRIELKPLAKKDRNIAMQVEAIKLLLNATYGRVGSVDSWLFDKQIQVNVCLTGQFSLLMLVEMFELNDIKVFSLNT